VQNFWSNTTKISLCSDRTICQALCRHFWLDAIPQQLPGTEQRGNLLAQIFARRRKDKHSLDVFDAKDGPAIRVPLDKSTISAKCCFLLYRPA
jgi:hypothetical protein